jgi:hypothetical protein
MRYRWIARTLSVALLVAAPPLALESFGAPAPGRYFLRAKAGHQCVSRERFKELAAKERRRLEKKKGIRIKAIWATS